MYDIILFDLDGTLTKSEVGIVNAITFALSKFNIEPTCKADLKKFIGPPLNESFIKHYKFSKEKAKKAVSYCQEYMQEKGIYEAPLYEGIIGANLDGTKTDKAEIISHVLDNYSINDKTKVVMVGDRKHDVIGARNNQIDSIGVLYGYGDYQELKEAGATYIINTPMDLLKMIE